MWVSLRTSKKAGDGVHVGQLELLDEVGDRSDLDAVGRTPAKEREVVHHRLGQVAAGPVVADRDVVAALRELLALLVTSSGRWAKTGW